MHVVKIRLNQDYYAYTTLEDPAFEFVDQRTIAVAQISKAIFSLKEVGDDPICSQQIVVGKQYHVIEIFESGQ
jgi:hypothetical protein